MMRVGVLASGSGSNFQALVDAINVEGSPARIVAMVGNVPTAKVFERARVAQVPSTLVDHTKFSVRAEFDEAVAAALKAHDVELVCLAGYMRLVTSTFLKHFPSRVINLHPALLPLFPGLHAARQALAAGVRVSGCTVHFVDEGTDTGPIIAQAVVPILPSDDEDTLSDRIHREEHRLFPLVVKAIARGDVKVEGRRVVLREAIA